MAVANCLLLLLLMATLTPARCSFPGPPDKELAAADAVFSGKVVGRSYIHETDEHGVSGERLAFTLKVERI